MSRKQNSGQLKFDTAVFTIISMLTAYAFLWEFLFNAGVIPQQVTVTPKYEKVVKVFFHGNAILIRSLQNIAPLTITMGFFEFVLLLGDKPEDEP